MSGTSHEHLVARFGVAALECRSWQETAGAVLRLLHPAAGAGAGLVFERSAEGARLRVVASAGLDRTILPETIPCAPGSIFDRALESPGAPVLLSSQPGHAADLPGLEPGAIVAVAFDAGAGDAGILALCETDTPLHPERTHALLLAAAPILEAAARRALADAGLRETDERLRLAQAAGRMGTFAWDVRSGAVEWSETLQILHGLSPGTFEGTFQAFTRDIYPDDVERVLAAIEHSLETGLHEIEYRIVLPTGRTLWISARGQVLYDAAGKPSRLIGICMDVTQRRRAEDALHLLADAATELAGSLDYETTLWNLAHLLVPRVADWCTIDMIEDGRLKHVVGLHRDPAKSEILARHVAEDLASDEVPQDVVRALTTGESVLFATVTPEMFAASTLKRERLATMQELGVGSAMVVPVRARGRTIGTLTLVSRPGGHQYDATDLALAEHIGRRAGLSVDNARLYQQARDIEAELRLASEAKDEFLGLMSHELRTPITVLAGGARLLRARGASLNPAEYEQVLADLESESDRLYRMVENLLALSRAELQGVVEAEPVLLQRVVPRAVEASVNRLRDRPVSINVDPEAPPVSGHEGYIEHVLRNLVSNANKYSPPGSPITVTVVPRGNVVEVSVGDRGPGLAEDEAEVIFERFYRSERTSGLAGGAGLGLAVCKRLIDTMNGTVWARPREGGGLEVGFTLGLYDTCEEVT